MPPRKATFWGARLILNTFSEFWINISDAGSAFSFLKPRLASFQYGPAEIEQARSAEYISSNCLKLTCLRTVFSICSSKTILSTTFADLLPSLVWLMKRFIIVLTYLNSGVLLLSCACCTLLMFAVLILPGGGNSVKYRGSRLATLDIFLLFFLHLHSPTQQTVPCTWGLFYPLIMWFHSAWYMWNVL